MHSRLRSLLGVLAALAVCLPVCQRSSAGSWPTPAAGPSRSGDPEVVFSFDDGPHERYTGLILDTLAAHHLQAIFFWVGDRLGDEGPLGDRRRAMVDRAIHEGHIVGNHTSTHAQLCTVTEERAARELDDNRVRLAALAHMPIDLLRVPYGSRCARLDQMLLERDLRHFHWDIDPQEWRHGSTKRTIAYVTAHLKRLRGRAVVLMHDVKRATAEALPKILEWIEAENVQRRALGQRQIRIISPSAVVEEESLPPGLARFLGDAAAAVARGAIDAIDALVP